MGDVIWLRVCELRLAVSGWLRDRILRCERSPLRPFVERAGEGVPDIRVSCDGGEGEPAGQALFQSDTLRVFDEGGWHLDGGSPEGRLRLRANSDWSAFEIQRVSEEDAEGAEEKLLPVLRAAFETRLGYAGGISIHASCVVSGGQAILFTAPSGTGKSTQAANWVNTRGAFILNGDRPALRPCAEGVRAYGMPWSGKEKYFVNQSAPVRAIVELRQSPRNRVRRLSVRQAVALLIKRTFLPPWDERATDAIVRTVAEVARRVPVYRLDCLPDSSASDLLGEVLDGAEHRLIPEGNADMRIRDDFVLRSIAGEWIAIPTGARQRTEGAIVLEEIGAFIWGQLVKPATRAEVLAAILERFDVGEEVAAADLDEFLANLAELGVLETEA